MLEIIIIAAMAKNRVIGKNNALPWHLKEDLIHFKELTSGCPCVMGRRTWDSLPKRPLPDRLNIIVTRTLDGAAFAGTPMVKALPSLSAAIDYCAKLQPSAAQSAAEKQKIFICGGESIYREALPLAQKIELTLINQNYEGDAFFPEIDYTQWKQIQKKDFDTYSFITFTRNEITDAVYSQQF
jgi:dihydrofolate reductase